ncbi:hypothetical protein SAMN05421505_103129 [Sinosporangium album]|uniref:Uncharacterized protein n=1 Tax=Sinosporangium album TaxID=504805 RepID=A0A1G7T8G8_9ACTN|nr:hypothetical protein [Sinosporangium album]SDG30900.1 hypothetical protein SAMN05421505_103129 [Sinosporangium album]
MKARSFLGCALSAVALAAAGVAVSLHGVAAASVPMIVIGPVYAEPVSGTVVEGAAAPPVEETPLSQ